MKTQHLINTKLKLSNIINFFIELTITLCFFLVLFSGLLSLLLWVIDTKIENFQHQTLLMAIYVLIILIYPIFFIHRRYHKYKTTEVWSLDKKTLLGGDPVKVKINLNNISKIIIGRPILRWYHILFTYRKTFIKKQKTPAINDGTIIIKLEENTYLPLDIQHLKNGKKLMTEIIKICQNKCDYNYIFSAKERFKLRPNKHNQLVIINE